jgi:hypothetical protein
MNRKTFAVVVIAMALGAASPVLGVVSAPEKQSVAETNEIALRGSLGFPAQPREKKEILVGPLLLSANEARAFETLGKMKETAAQTSLEALGDPAIVSLVYGADVLHPSVTLWVGPDENSKLGEFQTALVAIGFKVTVQKTAFSKANYLAARDAAAHELWGFSTAMDINPRVTQKGVVNAENLAVGQEIAELIRSLRKQGIEVFDGYLPSANPTIQLLISRGATARATSMVPSSLVGLVSVQEGGPIQQAQAGGPWAGSGTTWSGRLQPENVVRGGKRFSSSARTCTTGPAVRDQTGRDYIVAAGHCYDGVSLPLNPQPNASVGGVSITLFASCNLSTYASCSPYTYGGVDSSLWTSSNTITGWFVHQAPHPLLGAQYQGTAYTDATIGSKDLNAGDQLICIEGASVNKYGGASGSSATSACGVAAGWSLGGFYYLNMYPGNTICVGDSGGYVRNPSGAFSGGSYNAGHFRGFPESGNPEVGGCVTRYTSSSPELPAQVVTFYKTHLWISYHTSGGVTIWAKTW